MGLWRAFIRPRKLFLILFFLSKQESNALAVIASGMGAD
jgi:hypothetical protein